MKPKLEPFLPTPVLRQRMVVSDMSIVIKTFSFDKCPELNRRDETKERGERLSIVEDHSLGTVVLL